MTKICNMDQKRGYTAAQLMKQAFLELLCRKNYMDITVTDVITQAQVARVSFYRNFSSTSQLLDQVAEDLVAEFTERILPVLTSDDPRLWRDFLFQYIYRMRENQDYLARLRPENVSTVFSRIGDKVKIAESEHVFSSVREKYRISAATGAINNVVRHWIESGMKETPEEIVDFLQIYLQSI